MAVAALKEEDQENPQHRHRALSEQKKPSQSNVVQIPVLLPQNCLITELDDSDSK